MSYITYNKLNAVKSNINHKLTRLEVRNVGEHKSRDVRSDIVPEFGFER